MHEGMPALNERPPQTLEEALARIQSKNAASTGENAVAAGSRDAGESADISDASPTAAESKLHFSTEVKDDNPFSKRAESKPLILVGVGNPEDYGLQLTEEERENWEKVGRYKLAMKNIEDAAKKISMAELMSLYSIKENVLKKLRDAGYKDEEITSYTMHHILLGGSSIDLDMMEDHIKAFDLPHGELEAIMRALAFKYKVEV